MDASLGTRLYAWRTFRGLTLDALAKRANPVTTKQTLAMIECDQGALVSTIERVAKALGLTMAEFFGRLPDIQVPKRKARRATAKRAA